MAIALAVAAGPLVAATAAQVVEVAPGGVVVWRGDDATSCSMDGERWQPLAGDCWYPIDLLRAAGEIEVERARGEAAESRRVRVAEYGYPVQRITLQDDAQVHLSAEDLVRVQRDQEKVSALWSLRGASRFELPLAAPLARLSEGGRFGHRRFFNDEPRSPHSGADYAAAAGSPVLAAADGRAVLAEDLFFSGNSVFLDHGDGLITMYFHLSEMRVAFGDEVRRGQIVGRVGQTGRATGPHLHFGVRWRGARVDPELLLGRAATADLR